MKSISFVFDGLLAMIFLGLCFFLATGYASPAVAPSQKSSEADNELLHNFDAKKRLYLDTRNTSVSDNGEEDVQKVVVLTNDREYLKKHGSRSFRNNNPGNLRYVGQEGAIGEDGNGYAIFETFEAGKLAHLRQIELDAGRGMTLGDFVRKFAPKEENDPQNYIAFLLRRFPNATADTPVEKLNIDQVQTFMQQMEGWIEPEHTVVKEEVIVEEEKTIPEECETLSDLKERLSCIRNI